MVRPCVFVIGNPGAGKSTLCNSLGARFVSGISIGHGLTTELQMADVTINGVECTIVDAPGLYEPTAEVTRHNADRIQEGLNQGSEYKIVFVVGLAYGRWVAQDLSMVQAVTKAIEVKPDQVALLINDVDQDVMQVLEEDPNAKEALETMLGANGIQASIISYIGKLNLRTEDGIRVMRNKMLEVLRHLVPRRIKVVANITLTSEKIEEMNKSLKDLEIKLKEQEEFVQKERDRIDKMYKENAIKQDERDKMILTLEANRAAEIKSLKTQNRVLLGIVSFGGTEIYRWISGTG